MRGYGASIDRGGRQQLGYLPWIALNVNTDLSYFQPIKPSGLDPETITSMRKLAGREFSMHAVKEKVVANFSDVFRTRLEPKSLAGLNVSPQRNLHVLFSGTCRSGSILLQAENTANLDPDRTSNPICARPR